MPCLLQRLFPKETVSCCLVTPLPLGEGPGVRANGAKVYPPRFCWPFRLNLMTLLWEGALEALCALRHKPVPAILRRRRRRTFPPSQRGAREARGE